MLNFDKCFAETIEINRWYFALLCVNIVDYYISFSFLSISYWLCYYSFPNFFSSLSPLHSVSPHPPAFPHPLSSCPWVVHISSLVFLFSIPFLTSPCLFYAYQLCFLFPVPLPLHSSLPTPHWKPSMWSPFLWFYSRSSCLLSFCFCFLGSVVDSYEFVVILLFIVFFPFFKKDFTYLFLERGEGREKERERNINVWLPLARPLLETWPATQACALTGNWTGDSLVRRLALNPLSHISQSLFILFYSFLFLR